MEDPQESPAQRQARLRREKREKKILSGATSRLDKITSLSGGRPAEEISTIPANPATTQTPQFYPTAPSQTTPSSGKPNTTNTNGPTQAELEASMRELLRAPVPEAQAQQKTKSEQEQEQEQQDPMLALLQQMMSGSMPAQADGSAAPGPSFDGLPPGLAAMLGGNMGGNADGADVPVPKNVYAWKIAHALFSLCLGVYILYTYPFTGTFSARMRVGGAANSEAVSDARASVFWLFVTAELGLQGARYLLEDGAVEEGRVKTIAAFLPQPWRRRVELGSRYVGIWTTIVQDAFVIVFLLGVVAWWRG